MLKQSYRLAILGATGAVGREMLRVLEEVDFPIETLLPLASKKSAGSTISFRGQDITVQEATADSFAGMDFVLGAVGSGLARQMAPAIVAAGAVFIDNSSAFRMDDSVPLVVPEINGADAFSHRGIIANPNCSTIISLMAIAGIAKLSPIDNMVACTYQAVSGAGQGGLEELDQQMHALAAGEPVVCRTFPRQIALNVIPQISETLDNGYTAEEMKMQNEGRKILHLPDLTVSCTCVRVPVMRSHSIAITLRTQSKVSVQQAQDAIRNFPGCVLMEDGYPTPLDTSNQDLVWVGRIRDDLTSDRGLTLWCCGDQIRKGAATNAVQILQFIAAGSNN